MELPLSKNKFYIIMGMTLLLLVVTGFGSAAIVRGQNPLNLPLLYHLHAITYLIWFSLFIVQASLIANNHRGLHIMLGKLSLIVVLAMLITGWLMAQDTFARQASPIPGITIEQFMAFPFFDLLGLSLFYGLAIAKRNTPAFHKRAMLLVLIAIIDPASARIGIIIGFEPFPVLASIALVGAIICYDLVKDKNVHFITWIGVIWIFLRLGFVFGFAATDTWAGIAKEIFS